MMMMMMIHWSLLGISETRTYKLGEEFAADAAVCGTQNIDRRCIVTIELLHGHRRSLKVSQRLLQTYSSHLQVCKEGDIQHGTRHNLFVVYSTQPPAVIIIINFLLL